jgi:hypothetical protein
MEDKLIKVSIDLEKAKSILRMVELREKRIEAYSSKNFGSLLVEDYYEIIKELATALLCLEGYKTLSHKALFKYIYDKHSIFEFAEKELTDDLRKKRNKVVYNGFLIRDSYVARNLMTIKKLIRKYKSLLKENLMD